LTDIYQTPGLRCLSCSGTSWKIGPEAARCLTCGYIYAIDDGVLRMHLLDENDDVTQLYMAFDGTHFVNATFEDNPLINITTRAYRHFLEELFPRSVGSLMDFGCGDGRFSLWAAEKGFSPVVAVDSNLASLKRLATEARKRKLEQLVIVCADLKKPPFQPDHFDVVLCIEVLYYLVSSLGRIGAIKTPANLLSRKGKMVLGEFSRLGRAIIDLDAMDMVNVHSLVDSSTRWEKTANTRSKVFQWSLTDLRNDLNEAELNIIAQTGISLAAAIFNYAWNFTSYPLRPQLDAHLRELLELVCDQTSDAVDAARNFVFALEKFNKS
jgi:2-polyprenyl-3-methyl-5-hydroxy-6-metoxy-1,4-benzoquinol methylase